MLVPPIVERELRAALHKRGALKSRFRMAGYGVLVVAGFLVLGSLIEGGSWGRTLHWILFVWGLCLVVQPALTISVGLFSEERRNQTLELLYLTGINSGELFLGKLLGAVMMASSDLLAIFPLMAVPFLSGGISGKLFVATITCLPVALLFLVAAGLLASALCKDDGSAMVLGGGLTALICLATPLPYNLGRMLAGTTPFGSEWLRLSPALGPYMVYQRFGSFSSSDFWGSMAATLGWTGLCLALAAVALRYNWRQDVERAVATGWRAKWESFVHGGRAWRARLNERLMWLFPFQWLVEQDRQPVLSAWAMIGGFAFFWLLGWLAWRGRWASTANLLLTAFLLLIGIGWLRSYAAARRIGDDRRDGALELLLTTPLSPTEIGEGILAGLKSQFAPVRRALAGVFAVMMLGGFLTRTWTMKSAFTYVIIWCLLFSWCFYSGERGLWRVMWVSLNSGRPLFATLGAQGNRFSWIWIIFNLRNVGRAFGGKAIAFPSGSDIELFLCSFAAVAGVMVALALRYDKDDMRGRLIQEMRSIAQEPVPDPKDPRFKEWKDRTQRFPGHRQEQFPPLPRAFDKARKLG